MSRFAESEAAQAGIRIFSGRPDPTWPFPSDRIENIRMIWQELEPCHARRPAAHPRLGYRGCFAIARTERWETEDEFVMLESGDRQERRADPQRRIERAILNSAPAALRAELPDVFRER